MNDRLVTVRNFGDPEEASIAKEILDDHGITSCVQGAQSATTSLGGVNLQVPDESAELAAELLDKHLYPAETVWKCPKCGANNDEGFEICWQCSRGGAWKATMTFVVLVFFFFFALSWLIRLAA